MIKAISIKNYKSVYDLKFDLGQINVLIGENGGGKTNVLEAIAYGIAASLDKLDNEYLWLRGIRVTEPQFMKSAFGSKEEAIRVRFYAKEEITTKDNLMFQQLKSFVLYCPEESALRTYRDDIQMLPLGRKGEGLFRYLKELSNVEEGKYAINQIKEYLTLLDWFDGIDIPLKTMSKDYTINIKDKYITDTLDFFDQRSTNEGFLFLLFYLTLFISKDTPQFFAIDNIESSFNPKLCTKIMEVLARLAKENKKQVILTTHNPFILDGLDLSDSSQKLFVVRRNDEGHTKIKEIAYNPERTKKLSEIWMSGAIGGLPDNF